MNQSEFLDAEYQSKTAMDRLNGIWCWEINMAALKGRFWTLAIAFVVCNEWSMNGL